MILASNNHFALVLVRTHVAAAVSGVLGVFYVVTAFLVNWKQRPTFLCFVNRGRKRKASSPLPKAAKKQKSPPKPKPPEPPKSLEPLKPPEPQEPPKPPEPQELPKLPESPLKNQKTTKAGGRKSKANTPPVSSPVDSVAKVLDFTVGDVVLVLGSTDEEDEEFWIGTVLEQLEDEARIMWLEKKGEKYVATSTDEVELATILGKIPQVKKTGKGKKASWQFTENAKETLRALKELYGASQK